MADFNNSLPVVQIIAEMMTSAMSYNYPMIGSANKTLMNFPDKPYNYGDKISFQQPFYSNVKKAVVSEVTPVQRRIKEIAADTYFVSEVSLDVMEQTFFKLRNNQALTELEASFITNFAMNLEYDFGNHIKSCGYGIKQDSKQGAPITQIYHPESGPTFYYGSSDAQFLDYNAYLSAYSYFQTLETFGPSADVLYDAPSGVDIKNEMYKMFTPKRNDREVLSWEVMDMPDMRFNASMYLGAHYAGHAGEMRQKLTIKSVTRNEEGRIKGFICSGVSAVSSKTSKGSDSPILMAAPITNAVVMGDIGHIDATQGLPNIYWLRRQSHTPTSLPVQITVKKTADSDASGDVEVVISGSPDVFLSGDSNDPQRNIGGGVPLPSGEPTLVGRTITLEKSHKINGYISSGGHLFAAPPLPKSATAGELSHVATHPTTGVSIQITLISDARVATNGIVFRTLCGMLCLPENGIRMISAIRTPSMM